MHIFTADHMLVQLLVSNTFMRFVKIIDGLTHKPGMIESYESTDLRNASDAVENYVGLIRTISYFPYRDTHEREHTK